jgi:serine/threonine protein kinase
MPGERLGDYELIALIGAGGMGEVWRAHDPGLRRHVAIKILPPQYSQDPDRLRRFEQEARAAGMLNHPNVLSVYAIGRQDGRPYVVTELLDGITLRQRLTGGALPESTTLEYADQLVQGLAAAHDKGIVHRDLKPENVFITADERLKILDFGLAKLVLPPAASSADLSTASGIVLGTPGYMSPEQVRGDQADPRADIFAVGTLLYEMLSGRRPFLGETSVETMTAILKHEPPAIPGVSPQVQQIVRHCLEKDPAARYQSTRDLAFHLRMLRRPTTAADGSLPRGLQRQRIAPPVVGLLAVAAAAAVLTWWFGRSAPSDPSFRRLTADSGLTTDPALSPDGQLLAYASDRAGSGNLDIWRQQLSTGEAVRLTSDPADESEPAFSPDGGRIVFRSERDGGGIWAVSAFGGTPRLVAKRGRRPRFSPDGTRIAYWVATGPVPYIGNVFVVPAAGGASTAIAPTFASARYPVWSADGRHILLVGARDQKDIPRDGHDWWVVAEDGARAVKTGAVDRFRRQGLRDRGVFSIAPADWVDHHVFFSSPSEGTTNVWRLAIRPESGLAEGDAERLTFGTAVEAKPSVLAGNRIAFASLKQDLNIWSVPITPAGVAAGEPHQVTHSTFDAYNSLAVDGRTLAFISTRAGNSDVWIKDLVTSAETALTATSVHKEQPELTADGSRVGYAVNENSQYAIYEVATGGGLPQRICDGCGRPWDWSPDGRQLLYLIPEGARQPGLVVGIVDAATREKSVYLEHPEYSLARARFSPDGRWVSFTATAVNGGGHRIVIAPSQSRGASGEQWITVAEDTATLDKARWSLDGNLLYYVSEADGFRCIRGRRLHPETKRPVGEPIDVYHSHSARRSLMNPWLGHLEISLGPERLFFNLGEATGNIWLAEWKK